MGSLSHSGGKGVHFPLAIFGPSKSNVFAAHTVSHVKRVASDWINKYGDANGFLVRVFSGQAYIISEMIHEEVSFATH